MTKIFIWGNWYCSNGFNPQECPILDGGDRIACINITNVDSIVHPDYLDDDVDKCSWLLHENQSSTQTARKQNE